MIPASMAKAAGKNRVRKRRSFASIVATYGGDRHFAALHQKTLSTFGNRGSLFEPGGGRNQGARPETAQRIGASGQRDENRDLEVELTTLDLNASVR